MAAPMDALEIETQLLFSVPQCARAMPGQGWFFSPQIIHTTNRYTNGDSAEFELNGILALKLFVAPLDAEAVNISSTGQEEDPTKVVVRIADLKEFAFTLLRVNPEDDSNGPDEVTVTLSAELAAALGFPSAALDKTLQLGEHLHFSCPAGNTVPAGATLTVVNNDTMNYATVLAFASGFKV